MKKLLVFTSLFLIVLITTEVIVSAYLYANPITERRTEEKINKIYNSSKSDVELEYEALDKVQKQPKSIDELFVTGWIPDWDIPDGLKTLQANVGTFDGVSPVWFYLEADGTLKETPFTNGPALTDQVEKDNLELIPSIALFDAETLSSVLRSPENTDRHINTILDYAVENDYDGIDLDYESTFLADKELFYSFIEKLSKKLKQNGKKLIFTALPKWGDFITYPTLPQTRRVQEYKRLADLVDEFRIMTYDFYGRSSEKAGPVAPLEWMEYTIKYAIHVGIPREKIILGVPTYSYDWGDRELAPTDVDIINWYGNLTANPLEEGVAYFNSQVNLVRSRYTLIETFNDKWGDAIGTYDYKGQKRTIVFPTEKSFELRKQLAADYGLKGIAYWRLGDEDGLKL